MSRIGVLVTSNFTNLANSFLKAVKREYLTKTKWYVHINPNSVGNFPAKARAISHAVRQVYRDFTNVCPGLDVNIMITPFKQNPGKLLQKTVNFILIDKDSNINVDEVKEMYEIVGESSYIDSESESSQVATKNNFIGVEETYEVCENVVVGGTYDRMHIGHKILLSECCLRCYKRLVIGVTDENMIKRKTLPELILPLENRIQELKDFLSSIDSSLKFEIVPISDPFGPTASDPNLDLIVVSSETLIGAEKVNQLRQTNGLKPLAIHSIDLLEQAQTSSYEDSKVSSSNIRKSLLGKRIRPRELRTNLPSFPYIIGLTGGIASGKTKIANHFRQLGACTIDCDKLAHEMYEPGTKCYKDIVEYFGTGILAEDKSINRKILGSLVFANEEKLEALNGIVWPKLFTKVKQRINEMYNEKGCKIIFVEAAILLKAQWDRECHEVWSMIVPVDEAIRRVVERNKISEEDAKRILNMQFDNFTIVKRSDVVFSSQWSEEFTHAQAVRAFNMLKADLNL